MKKFFIFLLLFWLHGSHAAKVFVSNKVKSYKKNCGETEKTACPTIQKALENSKAHSDIIIMHTNKPYTTCPIYIPKPFTFTGNNKTHPTVIQCDSKIAFKIQYNKTEKLFKNSAYVSILLKNLEIRNSEIGLDVKDVDKKTILQISNSRFVDNTKDISIRKANVMRLLFTKVNFHGERGYNIEAEDFADLNVQYSDSKILGKSLKIAQCRDNFKLTMSKATWDFSRSGSYKKPGILVEMCKKKTVISLKNSSFENYSGSKSTFNVIGPKISKNTTIIVISMTSVKFVNNTVFGSGTAFCFNTTLAKDGARPAQITMTGCSFENNTALYEGGALWFGTWVSKSIYIKKCDFSGNKVVGNGGKGGAIYGIGGSSYDLIESRFINNSATHKGGTLYFDKCTVKIVSSIFKSDARNVTFGQFLHITNRNVRLQGKNNFSLVSNNQNKPVVWYDGDHGVIYMDNETYFECPNGYNIKDIQEMKRLEYWKYNKFGYICSPCQDKYYTAGKGFRHILGENNTAECYPCPEGAFCNGTIHARTNKWGMKNEKEEQVKMFECPKGYCCGDTTCDSYNGCQDNRGGTLCGRCNQGYSERLNSEKCHPDDDCSNSRLWVLLILTLAITFFWMFHQEIIHRLTHCIGSRKQRAYENTEIEMDSDTEKIPLQHSMTEDVVYRNPNNPFESQNGEANVVICPPVAAGIKKSETYNRSSGYIKILFYFYQILIYVRPGLSREDFFSGVLDSAKPILNFQFSDGISGCIFKGLTPVEKLGVKNTVGCWMILFLFLFYIMYRVVRRLFKKPYSSSPDDLPSAKARSFPVRLVGCYVQVLLLSYLAFIDLCVNLMYCIEINGEDLLHIDATMKCNSSSRVVAWIFFITFFLPFPFVLLIGRMLLTAGRITPKWFLISITIPPIFPFYCLYNRLHQDEERSSKANPYREKILYILQHPFREAKDGENKSLAQKNAENWECVLLLRRLVIVLVTVFVNPPHLRSIMIFFVCCCILLHHLLVLPFAHKNVNRLETISLLLIVFFTGIDIANSSFKTAGFENSEEARTLELIRDKFLMPTLPILLFVMFLMSKYRSRKRLNNTSSSDEFETTM